MSFHPWVQLLMLGLTCWLTGCRASAPPSSPWQVLPLPAVQPPDQQPQPVVYFRGTFKHPAIPWEEGLTLAQGLLNAEYLGQRDPFEVYLLRQGNVYRISTRRLLSGYNNPELWPDDIIEIRR